ncbi:hopanoid-associated phosphorylase [Sphingomonas vulcanisoli]|uniref:Hopanoid-associated phosphorylase n=1 Tax=Sphingomonas vulcanisoli TaxID=1658060 RepID=A0ABX0TU56_9SPHN|nr:hopanoid-associated phosphorylase [Sphingomonas vulcanisoli]
MLPILVATGFNREVQTLPTEGVIAVAGGGDAAALERNLSALAPNAAGIVSYGLTGALHDDLKIGDWIVGSRICGGIDLECDRVWSEALAARLPGARIGGFFADGRMIDTVAEKRDLGRCHTALAVDMESHVAARVAQAHGLPFVIVRIVSDEAGHLLPHAVTVCMKPDGSLDTPAMLKSLAADPRQLPDVVKTMANFAKGFRGLKAGAQKIGARMAFPG